MLHTCYVRAQASGRLANLRQKCAFTCRPENWTWFRLVPWSCANTRSLASQRYRS